MNSIIALDIDQTLIQGHTRGQFDTNSYEMLSQLGPDERRFKILKVLGELRNIGSIIVLITKGLYKNSKNLLNAFLLNSKEITGFSLEDLNIAVFGAEMTEEDIINELKLLDENIIVSQLLLQSSTFKSVVNVKIEDSNWHLIKSQGFIELLHECNSNQKYLYFFDDTFENVIESDKILNTSGFFISEYKNQLITNLESLLEYLKKENKKYFDGTSVFNGSVGNVMAFLKIRQEDWKQKLFLIRSRSKNEWYINSPNNIHLFNPITKYYQQKLDTVTSDAAASSNVYDHTRQKYLKYKYKYLQLKK